ncbi:PT domain-containing protein, partial [bacterium]|nr:PT domain-containing protein [bacterium]
TGHPSGEPSGEPSGKPTGHPTNKPSGQPTGEPSSKPSGQPTGHPSGEPSGKPTGHPTGNPISSPSRVPTKDPSSLPTFSSPTGDPTGKPTSQPTHEFKGNIDGNIVLGVVIGMAALVMLTIGYCTWNNRVKNNEVFPDSENLEELNKWIEEAKISLKELDAKHPGLIDSLCQIVKRDKSLMRIGAERNDFLTLLRKVEKAEKSLETLNIAIKKFSSKEKRRAPKYVFETRKTLVDDIKVKKSELNIGQWLAIDEYAPNVKLRFKRSKEIENERRRRPELAVEEERERKESVGPLVGNGSTSAKSNSDNSILTDIGATKPITPPEEVIHDERVTQCNKIATYILYELKEKEMQDIKINGIEKIGESLVVDMVKTMSTIISESEISTVGISELKDTKDKLQKYLDDNNMFKVKVIEVSFKARILLTGLKKRHLHGIKIDGLEKTGELLVEEIIDDISKVILETPTFIEGLFEVKEAKKLLDKYLSEYKQLVGGIECAVIKARLVLKDLEVRNFDKVRIQPSDKARVQNSELVGEALVLDSLNELTTFVLASPESLRKVYELEEIESLILKHVDNYRRLKEIQITKINLSKCRNEANDALALKDVELIRNAAVKLTEAIDVAKKFGIPTVNTEKVRDSLILFTPVESEKEDDTRVALRNEQESDDLAEHDVLREQHQAVLDRFPGLFEWESSSSDNDSLVRDMNKIMGLNKGASESRDNEGSEKNQSSNEGFDSLEEENESGDRRDEEEDDESDDDI